MPSWWTFYMHRRQFLNLSAVTATAPLLSSCGGAPEEFPVSIKSGFADSDFTSKSTAEDVTKGLDLSGKTMLITGCNSGIGFETMRVLALRGAHVIGTGRTIEKASAACANVVGKTTPLAMELTSFESVLDCENQVQALGIPLDALICNAGISGRKQKQVVNGIEIAFLVNYLSHFLFLHKLLPVVTAAEQGRIVHVGSRAGYTRTPPEGIRFNTLGESNGGFEYDSWEYYGQSKLANALFSRKLAQKLAGTTTTSNALHPGFVKTSIARGQGRLTELAFDIAGPLIAKNIEEGAATTCYAASYPELAKASGEFLFDSNVVTVGGTHHMEDNALADRLWTVSEQMLGSYLS
ncbi:MAG: NAD(P)-dependent dehydrogenase (short-subunit alcohol dehydrogenase family) [Arenicella sp.]|jgi:NAD(P)-dependent dehydrogenase (short-subunit alcohol dehydrogenase family)